MNKRWVVIPLAVVAIVVGTTAFAQAQLFDDPGQGPGPGMGPGECPQPGMGPGMGIGGGPGQGDGPGMQKHEKLRERIELMAMWKLTDALDLDQETAAKLFPMLHEFNAQQQELREKRREIIVGLKTEVEKKKPNSDSLSEMIEDFKENEIELVKQRNKKLDELSKLLTEEQVAKMIVFVPQFERDVRQMIDDVRMRRHERQGKPGTQGQQKRPPMQGGQQRPPVQGEEELAPPPEEDLP